MKETTKKSILKKILISLIIVATLGSFIIPTVSNAGGDLVDTALSIVQRVVISIGDGIMWIANGVSTGDWKNSKSVYVWEYNPNGR